MKIENLGSNLTKIEVGPVQFYVSYETVIAFKDNGELCISENEWSRTTGGHLNEIDPDKSKRIPYSEFKEKLETLELRLNI